MNKKQKIKVRNSAIVVVVGILIIGVGYVSAGTSLKQMIADKAGEILGLSLSQQIQIEPDDPDTLGGTISEKWVKQGNRVTYIESGDFKNASTTLVSFPNPFGTASTTAAAAGLEQYAINFEGTNASSTVVSVNLEVKTAATTTMAIVCGASANAFSYPAYEIINLTLPTSTTGVYENNVATTTSGFNVVGTGTLSKLILSHGYSYFTCFATGTPGTVGFWSDSDLGNSRGAVTEPTNAFDGNFSVEIRKNLQ